MLAMLGLSCHTSTSDQRNRNVICWRVNIKIMFSLFICRPCDYYRYRRRVEPVDMAFGKQRYVIPGYAVFCGAENKSKCFKCQTQPVGDYYHNFAVHLDLCRPCMNAELEELNNCKYDRLKRSSRLRELGKFKPARWCHFYHKHYSGNLAVNKYSRSTLRLKNRVENYLQSYDTLQKWYVQY